MQAVLTIMMLSVFSYCEPLTSSEQVIPANKVKVIFYTDKGDTKHVATVKIEDRVVGAIPPKHFTEAFVCKEKIRVGVADRGKIVKPTRYYDMPLNDESPQSIYYRIDESSDNYYSLTPVDEKTALDTLSKMDAKSRVINRYMPNCELSATNIKK